jgi:hypothetical protein
MRRNMNLPASFDGRAFRLASPVKSFLVIHDDVTAGIRAKRLADQIATSSGHGQTPKLALWLQDMLGIADCAVAAWLDAEKSDAVLISLRAGTELSSAVMAWLEAWLPYAGGERTRIVVLSESLPGDEGDRAALRAWFQYTTRKYGVELHWFDGSMDEVDATADAADFTPGGKPVTFAPGPGFFTAAAAFAA